MSLELRFLGCEPTDTFTGDVKRELEDLRFAALLAAINTAISNNDTCGEAPE